MEPLEELRTVGGLRVIDLHFVPRNSIGEKVTFPIKGTVIMREEPLKKRYEIWMENGRFSVFKPSKFDLAF